jgi:Uma2 family endonuclease
LPNSGGQTTEEDEYLVGALELVLEVASSSEAIDLHAKKADYERYGVKEYLVISLCPKKFYAFLLRENKFVEPPASPDGIYRSTVFPGLWIDPTAFLTGDQNRVREVLAAGLASPEHTAFVERLAAYCSEHPS